MVERVRAVVILYFISTAFFIYQHSLGPSWDFTAYSLNAEYMFSNGNYFEWYRAPLSGFLIGIFTYFILPFWLAEYLYIIFVSSLFLYSCIKFSKVFNLNPTLFYILMLNPFLILVGLVVGTELLTLSLLLLFISYIFSEDTKPIKSGISCALAFLARYSALPYAVLIFLSKNIKKNILNFFLFTFIAILIFFPWFLYNYFHTQHFLTSIADSQALNIKYRLDYLVEQPSIIHFLIVGNFLIPFFILGLNKKIKKLNKKDISVLIFLAITLLFYLLTPIKTPRYLFNLILPFAYFSYFYIKEIKYNELLFFGLSVFSIISLLIINFFISLSYLSFPKKELYKLNLTKECALASNDWVRLNYFGYLTIPPPRKEELSFYIEEGYKVVIYYNVHEPKYSNNLSFLQTYPIIEKTENYIILGYNNTCKKISKVDLIYLERLNKTLTNLYNYSIETNPCKSLGFGIICDYFQFL
jgi:hypothetical protein